MSNTGDIVVHAKRDIRRIAKELYLRLPYVLTPLEMRIHRGVSLFLYPAPLYNFFVHIYNLCGHKTVFGISNILVYNKHQW